jgi:hypothetical protein
LRVAQPFMAGFEELYLPYSRSDNNAPLLSLRDDSIKGFGNPSANPLGYVQTSLRDETKPATRLANPTDVRRAL